LKKSTDSLHGLLVVVCIIIILWGAKAGQSFFVPLLLSAMLAFTGAPIVRALKKRHVPELLSVCVATVVLLTPLCLVLYASFLQMQTLASDFPSLLKIADKHLAEFSTTPWLSRFGIRQQFSVATLLDNISERAGEGVLLAASFLHFLAIGAFEIVIILIFGIMMLVSRGHLHTCSKEILARWEGIDAATMLAAVTELVEKFLLTKLIVAVVVGIVSTLALWATGIQYSLLLGVMTGVLTFLPELGFVIGLIPVVLVALLTGSGFMDIFLALSFISLIHLIEANILTPKLVGKSLNLNALSTFIGLFGGGLLWGVWGMFLSVPILGIVRISFSVVPQLAPWGNYLAEREDRALVSKLMGKKMLYVFENSPSLRIIRRKKPPLADPIFESPDPIAEPNIQSN